MRFCLEPRLTLFSFPLNTLLPTDQGKQVLAYGLINIRLLTLSDSFLYPVIAYKQPVSGNSPSLL